MKKKIILGLVLITLTSSIFAAEGPKRSLGERFHSDVSFGYSPSFHFDPNKEDKSLSTKFSNSFIINTLMSLDGWKVGLNIGTYGSFPFMTQVKKGNSIINKSVIGVQEMATIGFTISPSITDFKNDISTIVLFAGAKVGTEFLINTSKVKVTTTVGADAEVQAKILGNDYMSFLIGIKNGINFYEFGNIATKDSKENFKGTNFSYELLPYIGINLSF